MQLTTNNAMQEPKVWYRIDVTGLIDNWPTMGSNVLEVEECFLGMRNKNLFSHNQKFHKSTAQAHHVHMIYNNDMYL